MGEVIAFVVVVAIAVWLLRGFDRRSARGPRQEGPEEERRVPCPYCAEKILPAAKLCPFCKSSLVDK